MQSLSNKGMVLATTIASSMDRTYHPSCHRSEPHTTSPTTTGSTPTSSPMTASGLCHHIDDDSDSEDYIMPPTKRHQLMRRTRKDRPTLQAHHMEDEECEEEESDKDDDDDDEGVPEAAKASPRRSSRSKKPVTTPAPNATNEYRLSSRITDSMLPSGFERESLSSIRGLFKDREKALDTVYTPTLNGACATAKRNTFFNTHVRRKIELLAWQRLSLVIPNLDSWDHLAFIPEQTKAKIERTGCIFMSLDPSFAPS